MRKLAEGPYAGFNHTHLKEILADREGIHLSRSAVGRTLLAVACRAPAAAELPGDTLRREGYPQEGMLLRVYGNRHDWLEGRGAYPDPRRRCGRRHQLGPLRAVQTARGCPQLLMLENIIQRQRRAIA